MRIKELTYKWMNWSVGGLQFDKVNLIVGKNAVGKSRAIGVLNLLVDIILQRKETSLYDSVVYRTVFSVDDDSELIYEFTFANGLVVFESLKDNKGREYIFRNPNQTKLYGELVNPPSNKLAISVRRDVVTYPQIEDIFIWAEEYSCIQFNAILPSVVNGIFPTNMMPYRESLVSMFEFLDETAHCGIIKDMNDLGYSIEKLDVTKLTNLKILNVKEKGVSMVLWEDALSTGMLRALYLIIFVYYISARGEKGRTFVIDDFCEGVDYDRAIKLGKYLYQYCLANDIQLITASNDNFLMDVVDTRYWNILQRNGDAVTAINIHNNPELFEKFDFTGLSNFDLFSSDFIARYK